MDRFARDGVWCHADTPPLARDRHVTIPGMGELGQALAAILCGIGFRGGG